MTTLHHITPQVRSVEHTEAGANLQIFADESLDYFAGHFPQQPILAGVVQLHWAVQYAFEHLSLTSHVVESVEVLKFQVVIPPNTELTLSLTKKAANKFTFSYSSALGVHASGRVKVCE